MRMTRPAALTLLALALLLYTIGAPHLDGG
jgi:hypothetical protein